MFKNESLFFVVMKVLCFTDWHGGTDYNEFSGDALASIKKKAKNVDLILCTGDITLFGNAMEEVLEFINSLGKKVLLIPGNHEDEDELEAMVKNFKNIVYLHKHSFEFKGFTFLGWGGGGFGQRDLEFEAWSLKVLKKYKKKKLVLLLHGPPFGTEIDYRDEDFGNVGCLSYRIFIEAISPLAVFSGHIHETYHKRDVLGKTKLYNCGPDGEIITL